LNKHLVQFSRALPLCILLFVYITSGGCQLEPLSISVDEHIWRGWTLNSCTKSLVGRVYGLLSNHPLRRGRASISCTF